ncbi:MFS transporter [Haloferula sp.]|uniref:MFS transporter n=1 Tax=Haloferula sp. TaxID=2497595 RepID=UPI00329C7825
MDKKNSNAFIYATIVAMGGFLFGLDAVLISGTLDFLKTEFGLSSLEVGTAASAPALGVLIALPFAGWISDRFGRKKAILLVAILYLVSALGSAFAPSFEFLVAARFLGGLAFSSITLASMYIGEIAPPVWRGKLVSMTQINIVIGLSGAYFVNYFILDLAKSDAAWVSRYAIDSQTWRWMLGAEVPFALLWFFLLFRIPESPYWLVLRNRLEDAKKTLRRIYDEDKIEPHITEMRESLEKSTGGGSIGAQFKEIFSSPMRLTLIIAFTIAIAQQATGINAILVYAPTVFQQLGGGENAAFSQAVWVGLTALVFTVFGLLLVDKIGRRPLIIGGLIWVVLSLGISSYAFKQARYTFSSDDFAELSKNVAEEKTEFDGLDRLNALVDVEYQSDIEFKDAIAEVLGEKDAETHQNMLVEKSLNMNATLVLVCILSVVAAFHISIGPLMWVLFSEIFPISIRGLAIPLFAIISSLINWVVQQFFPWQLENQGMSGIFLTYGAVVAVGLVVLFFTLRETKGMTIEEIQAAFRS